MELEYGEQSFTIKKRGLFFLSQEIRDGMDTYQVIDSGRSVMGGSEMNIVQKTKSGSAYKPRRDYKAPYGNRK